MDTIGPERCGAVGGRSSKIVPNDDGLAGAECLDQRKGVARQRLLVCVTIGDRRGVVPAREGADRAISLGGDSGTKIVPGMRGIGEPVQHQHGRPGPSSR